jgi:hypothetical protein
MQSACLMMVIAAELVLIEIIVLIVRALKKVI